MNQELNKKKGIYPAPAFFESGAGFTLIELLAVIIVVVSVGYVITAILVSSLRGTNKTNTIDKVRSNGTYAISQMSKMIEFAKKLDSVKTSAGSTYSSCFSSTAPTPTPAGLPEYSDVTITSFGGGQTTFSCSAPPAPAPATIAATSASTTIDLIDTNTVSVVPGSCYFTCSQDSIALPPTIGINFSLSAKTASGFPEQSYVIPFSTSVTMRNF